MRTIMKMKCRAVALFAPLALMSLACPTRASNNDARTGASAGQSGAAGVAGQAGMEGGGGIGGTGAGAGGVGSGGTAGGTLGGASDEGGFGSGAAGNAGAAGSVGSAGSNGSVGGTAGVGAHVGGASGTGAVQDGQPCAISKDCASADCTPFYVDIDGDGYGAGQAMGFCGLTPPIGYAAQSGDCCDTAANLTIAKLIHPGADFQTTSAGGACGITWDYDCSGTVQQSAQNIVGCKPYPDCSDIFGAFPDSDCGESVSVGSCGAQNNLSACVQEGAPVGQLRCK